MTTRDRQKLLTQRGIGKRFQSMSLTDYDHPITEDLLKFVKEYDGTKNVVFYGANKSSYELTVLTARALILSGSTSLEVVDFIDLCDEETLENLPNKPLCILNYQPDSRFVDSKTYKKLERKLFQLLDNGYAIITHSPYSPGTNTGIPNEHDIHSWVLGDMLSEIIFKVV